MASKISVVLEFDSAPGRKELDAFQASLDKLAQKGGATLTQIQKGMQNISQSMGTGLNNVRSSVNRLQEPLDQLAKRWGSLSGMIKNALVFKGTEFIMTGINQFLQLPEKVAEATDKLEMFRARLKALTGDVEAPVKAMSTMLTLGAPAEQFGQLFAMFAISRNSVGASTEELVKFTETLINLGRLGGGSIVQMTQYAVQLAQGIAAGRLQGQDLKAVFEEMPMVAKTLAEALGVNVGTLRKMGEEGRLGPLTVFQGILKAGEQNAEQISKLPYLQEQITSNMATQGQLLLEQVGYWTHITDLVTMVKLSLTKAMEASRLLFGGEIQSSQDRFMKFFSTSDFNVAIQNTLGRIQTSIEVAKEATDVYGTQKFFVIHPEEQTRLKLFLDDLMKLDAEVSAIKSKRPISMEDVDKWIKRLNEIVPLYEEIRKKAASAVKGEAVELPDIMGPEGLSTNFTYLQRRYRESGIGRTDLVEFNRRQAEVRENFEREQTAKRETMEKELAEKFKGIWKDVAENNVSAHQKMLDKILENRVEATEFLAKKIGTFNLSLEDQALIDEILKNKGTAAEKLIESASKLSLSPENRAFLVQEAQKIVDMADKAIKQEDEAHKQRMGHLQEEIAVENRKQQAQSEALQRQKKAQEELLRLRKQYEAEQQAQAISGMPASLRGNPAYGNLGEVSSALDQAAKDFRVSRALLYAVAAQESGFDPRVRGRDRQGRPYEYGLMQITPENWGRETAQLYGQSLTGEEWKTPLINARVGAHMLATNLRATNGDIWAALKMYNGGMKPGAGTGYADTVFANYQKLLREGMEGTGGTVPNPKLQQDLINASKKVIDATLEIEQRELARALELQFVQQWRDQNKGEVVPPEVIDQLRNLAEARAKNTVEAKRAAEYEKIDQQATEENAKAKENYRSIMKQADDAFQKRSAQIEQATQIKNVQLNVDELLLRAQIALYSGEEEQAKFYEEQAVRMQQAKIDAEAEAQAKIDLATANAELANAKLPKMTSDQEAAFVAERKRTYALGQDARDILGKQDKADLNRELEGLKGRYVNFAQEAAKAMESSFDTMFFNAMQGKFESLETDFKTTIDRMVAHALAAQLADSLFGSSFMVGQGPENRMSGWIGDLWNKIQGNSSGGNFGQSPGYGMMGMTDTGSSFDWTNFFTMIGSYFMYHQGGIVGEVRRMHGGGLASDEVPVILQKGEGVFTKSQMRELGLMAGGSKASKGNITVNLNVNSPMDQTGWKASKTQIMGEVLRQISNAQRTM